MIEKLLAKVNQRRDLGIYKKKVALQQGKLRKPWMDSLVMFFFAICLYIPSGYLT
jgi:hypothetical protein